jgi:prevent-host-death family protein
MKDVSVTELKARLSSYLRLVKRGGEVQILERGVPVARLTRAALGRGPDRDRLARLVRGGILRRGTGDLGWMVAEAPVSGRGGSLLAALDEDREKAPR